jgi:plasmid stabilization system protein ParE
MKESPTAARAFGDAAIKAGRSLAEFPERGRLVPELAEPAVRELLLARYRLVYEVFAERVVVLRVIHASRDFERAWRGIK